jgi:hypothetical protein
MQTIKAMRMMQLNLGIVLSGLVCLWYEKPKMAEVSKFEAEF